MNILKCNNFIQDYSDPYIHCVYWLTPNNIITITIKYSILFASIRKNAYIHNSVLYR